MKKIITTTATVLLCMSCSTKEWTQVANYEPIIFGNRVNSYGYTSRGATSLLPEGTTISFYSENGIKANGDILTLKNNQWYGENDIYWIDNKSIANVNAYNPPLPTSSDLFYQPNGQLQDFLIAQGQYTHMSPINLHFRHLFSQIRFTIDGELNKKLEKLEFSFSHKITKVNPYTGEIITETDHSLTNFPSIHFSPNSMGSYIFLLPPEKNQSIRIRLQTQGGNILQKDLTLLSCEGNRAYNCNIKENSSSIGIYSAEDFIAFTYLINNKSYKGRNLDEFRKVVDGKTVYYLRNDITFSEEDKKAILQIGISSKFNDVFDGQGHTLYNLSTQESSNSNAGLFTTLDKSGIIKDLTIANSTISYKKRGGYESILCGLNAGTIINCKIDNCTIHFMKEKVGGLVGRNEGDIINCNIDGLRLNIPSGENTAGDYFGALVCFNHSTGRILNCKVSNVTRNNSQKVGWLSAIANINYNILSNCMCDKCPSDFHPFCNNKSKMPDHCYYPINMNQQVLKDKELKGKDLSKYSIASFSHNETELLKIASSLNNWIDKEGKKEYPNYVFRRWKQISGQNIVFE